MHLHPHIKNTELRSDNTLHVVGVVSNPVRWQSRIRLLRKWLADMAMTPHVQVYVVESIFGDRQSELDGLPESNHLQVRTNSEIWSKECLINLGVRRLLPRDWKYLCWCDVDIHFRDNGWAQETLHQLQHSHVVQPWQTCADLSYDGAISQTHTSFGWLCQQGVKLHPAGKAKSYWGNYGHPGFAWSCTRTWYEYVSGLIDCCILGSGDIAMAYAMIGNVDLTIRDGMQPSFVERMHD